MAENKPVEWQPPPAVDWIKDGGEPPPDAQGEEITPWAWALACQLAAVGCGSGNPERPTAQAIQAGLAAEAKNGPLNLDSIAAAVPGGIGGNADSGVTVLRIDLSKVTEAKVALAACGGGILQLLRPSQWATGGQGHGVWDAGRGVRGGSGEDTVAYVAGYNAAGDWIVYVPGREDPIRLTARGVGVCHPTVIVPVWSDLLVTEEEVYGLDGDGRRDALGWAGFALPAEEDKEENVDEKPKEESDKPVTTGDWTLLLRSRGGKLETLQVRDLEREIKDGIADLVRRIIGGGKGQ